MCGHVVVGEVPVVEQLDGRRGLLAVDALGPAIDGLDGHHGVDEHERGDDDGDGVARLPRDAVDEREQARKHELDPHGAEYAPHAHVEEVGPAVDVHEGAGVIPAHDAKGSLPKPADGELERTADDGADEEDGDEVALVEAVERHGHEQRTHAVDGGERAKEHAAAVHEVAVLDQHEADLEEVTQDAADEEDPKAVEEVQGDVALAGGVAAEHAGLQLALVFHGAQLAAEAALLLQGGVEVGGDGELADHNRQEDEGDIADAKDEDVEEEHHAGRRHEDEYRARGVLALVLDDRDAEQQVHRCDEDEDDGVGGIACNGDGVFLDDRALGDLVPQGDEAEHLGDDDAAADEDAQDAKELGEEVHAALVDGDVRGDLLLRADIVFLVPESHGVPFAVWARSVWLVVSSRLYHGQMHRRITCCPPLVSGWSAFEMAWAV